jgi:hypothetical protein
MLLDSFYIFFFLLWEMVAHLPHLLTDRQQPVDIAGFFG